MTRREKIFALCVAGTLGGLGLWKASDWAVVQPLKRVQEQIATKGRDGAKLEARLSAMRNVEREWTELTARTLAAEPLDAQRRFREDLHQLLELHGLHNAKISTNSFVKFKNGFIGVPLSITAEGSLKQIVGFMTDFYRARYLARIDKVTIGADQGLISSVNSPKAAGHDESTGRRGSAARSRGPEVGPDGPTLRFTLQAQTLVLPPLEKLGHPLMDEVTRDERGRLPSEVAAYEGIIDHSLFAPYTPKVAAVTTPVAVTPPEPRETNPPPPPPPPPPERPNKRVIAAEVLNGEPIAYVMEEGGLDKPEAYHLDEPFDDGTLLLVHSRGVVVRVHENGRDVDYYYRLGGLFSEREPLDANTQPEIAAALRDAFEPAQ